MSQKSNPYFSLPVWLKGDRAASNTRDEGVPGSIYINGILYNLRTRQDGTPLMRSTGEYLYRKA